MLIIFIVVFYMFISVLCFKILEKKGIGFSSYWYDNGKYLDNDKDFIWAAGAISMSFVWPVIFPILVFSKIIDKYIIKKDVK